MKPTRNCIYHNLTLCLAFFLLALLLFFGNVRSRQEALAARLAPSILRFHILANSDKNADQEIKLEVRSLILDYMQEHLSASSGKAETIQYMEDHRAAIESTANDYLARNGFDYQARLELTNCYFPTRAYDRMVIPCGNYDAARIILGKGKGHNWWCVLYPRFCFVDAACTEVPEESRQVLQETLNQDDYLALKDNRPDVEIRFKLFPSVVLKPVTLQSPDRQLPSHRSPSPEGGLS